VTFDATKGIVNQVLMNNAKWRLWYGRSQQLEPGKPVRFATVLLPHEPLPDASSLAEGIEVLRDTDACTVVKISRPKGPTWWVGLNESGERITAGDVVTDARQFAVEKSLQGEVRCWVIQGTVLEVEGNSVFTCSPRANVGPTEETSATPQQ
jgi:hypothetical protein